MLKITALQSLREFYLRNLPRLWDKMFPTIKSVTHNSQLRLAGSYKVKLGI